MPSTKEVCDRLINGKKVMVFSKSYCPYCTKAKKVLEKLIANGKLSSEDYEVLEIEDRDDCEDIQNYLRSLTGARSVPRVFIKGKCIGGGDETAQLASSGKLVALVQ